MMKRSLLILLLGILATAPAALAADDAASSTWEQRRDQLVQLELKKQFPPNGLWHDEIFALAAFWSNTRIDEANAAVLHDAEQLPDSLKAGDAHWHIFIVARLYWLFGPQGTIAANRMSTAAQEAALKMMWDWAAPLARRAVTGPAVEWDVWGSENHMAQAWASLWSATHILATAPDYQSRKFSDGSTPAQLAGELDEYWKQWALDRASRGLLVEINSNYNRYTVSTFYNLYDFATDPELKRRMGLLLDLFWADWSIENVDGLRGGSRSRSYPGVLSVTASSLEQEGWLNFGLGSIGNQPTIWSAATSTYRPPAEVVDLATHPEARGTFAYVSRRLGLAARPTETNTFFGPKNPLYHVNPDDGLLRYSYITPDFVLGASITGQRPPAAWTAIASQNRWDGVLFAGNATARIFVQADKPAKGWSYNACSTAASKGVFVAQRIKGAAASGNRAWFDATLKTTEKDGWVFAEAPQAFAAVKFLRGKSEWKSEDEATAKEEKISVDAGRWLTCDDELAPMVMEVVSKSTVPTLDAFEQKIAASHAEVKADGRATYRSAIYDTTISLGGANEPVEIDGKPVDFKPKKVYDSPFISSDFGSGVVTITDTQGHKRVLDFNTPH